MEPTDEDDPTRLLAEHELHDRDRDSRCVMADTPCQMVCAECGTDTHFHEEWCRGRNGNDKVCDAHY